MFLLTCDKPLNRLRAIARSEIATFSYPPLHITPPLGCSHWNSGKQFGPQKTRIMGLPDSEGWAVSTQYQRVTDRGRPTYISNVRSTILILSRPPLQLPPTISDYGRQWSGIAGGGRILTRSIGLGRRPLRSYGLVTAGLVVCCCLVVVDEWVYRHLVFKSIAPASLNLRVEWVRSSELEGGLCFPV